MALWARFRYFWEPLLYILLGSRQGLQDAEQISAKPKDAGYYFEVELMRACMAPQATWPRLSSELPSLAWNPNECKIPAEQLQNAMVLEMFRVQLGFGRSFQ